MKEMVEITVFSMIAILPFEFIDTSTRNASSCNKTKCDFLKYITNINFETIYFLF